MTAKDSQSGSGPSGRTGAKRFIPRFILDEPASKNALNGREGLAETIADTIHGDPRIKFIGILGEWGSGKSTIVGMLQALLQSPSHGKVLCFTYDAWLHQSDPPKRSFLEALVRFVGKDERLKINTSEWDGKLAELHRQVETSQVVSNPRLTLPAKLMLPALFFVAVGLKLIGSGVLPQDLQRDPASIAFFSIGWALTLAPVGVLLAFYLCWRPWREKFTWSFFWRHRKAHADESLLAVFANKPIEFKQEQKSKGPEPSAIEFQDVFRGVVEAVQCGGQRLVIIIDNLDRVSATDQLAMWSTLRSFFLGADHAGRPLTRDKLPTIVLPLASKGLGASAEGGDSAFSEKTFDLVFNVPPPVLSQWNEYLRTKIRDVFGERVDPSWLHSIPALYEAFARQANASSSLAPRLTPRSMNLFVNAIAVHWMQRGEDVPLETIAHFVLRRVASTADVYIALAEGAPAVETYDPDWSLGVAALYYGVAKADAGELFMERPIRDAIRLQDADNLTKLSLLPGFERYFSNVLALPGGGEDGLDPQRAARMLRVLHGKPDASAWTASAWRSIRNILPNALPQHPLDPLGIGLVFQASTDRERQTLAAAVNAILSAFGADRIAAQREAYLDTIELLKGEADRLGLTPTPVMTPNLEIYLSIMSEPARTNLRGWIDVAADATALTGRIVSMLQNGEQNLNAAEAIRGLGSQTKHSIDWSSVIEVANSLVRNAGPPSSSESLKALDALRQSEPRAQEILSSIARDSALRSALERMWSADSADSAFALGVSMALIEKTPLPNFSWPEVIQQEPALAEDIVSLLDETELTPIDFRMRQQSWPQERAITSALFTLWFDQNGISNEHISDAIDNIATYDEIVEGNARANFWQTLVNSSEFDEIISSYDFETIREIAMRVLEPHSEEWDIAAQDTRNIMLGVVQRKLERVTEAEWRQALQTGSTALDLMSAVTSASIPTELQRALEWLAARMPHISEQMERLRWFSFVQPKRGPMGAQDKLLDHLRTVIDNSHMPEHLAELLDLSHGQLTSGFIAAKGLDGFVRIVVLRLIDTAPGRAWLERHSDQASDWYAQIKPAMRKVLRDRVEKVREAQQIGWVFPGLS